MESSPIETVFPPTPESVAAARRFLRAVLTRSGADERLIEDAILALSELVTNAVVHARTELRVRVTVDPDRVRVDVLDSGPGRAGPRTPAPPDLGGRGLHIVEQLSDRWATRERDDGCGVWFELRRTL
ncbi:MAG: ATP-binding protein [Acidimicrobiia bacterium]